MATVIRRFFLTISLHILFLFLATIPAFAADTCVENTEAVDVMDASIIVDQNGFPAVAHLYDKDDSCGLPAQEDCSLTLAYPEGIGSLYIVFYEACDEYTITDNASGIVYTRENPFLHDFVDLQLVFCGTPTSVTITFSEKSVIINEIYAFSEGQVPAFVQQWKLPREGNTDLVLFSSHGDDEHFFCRTSSLLCRRTRITGSAGISDRPS